MASQQRWALITGVSEGGLGDALVKELLAKGIHVIATGLKLEHLDYLSNDNISQMEKLELDVTSTSSISAAVTRVRDITGGRLHILINNAGYGYMMPLMDADLDKVRRNFDVNVFGVLAVTQAFLPLIREAKGMVVNQASIASLPSVNQPYIGSYSASKTALLDLGNTLRVELKPFDITVITLVTGDVKTHFWDNTPTYHVGLPPSSLYLPIRAKVEDMMAGKTNPPGQHTSRRWANAVVTDLLQSNPPRYIRRGYLATIMPCLSWLLPVWMVDWMFTMSSDLGKLKSIVTSQESKRNR